MVFYDKHTVIDDLKAKVGSDGKVLDNGFEVIGLIPTRESVISKIFNNGELVLRETYKYVFNVEENKWHYYIKLNNNWNKIY